MPLRGPFVIMGALGLAVLAASLFAVLTSIGRAEAITMSPVSTLITIDAHYGATFAAPPSNAAPALTAQRAWAQFTQQASGSSNTAIPSSVTAQLGHFTLPVGPDCGASCSNLTVQNGTAYTALNELAYGYSWPGGMCSRGNDITQLPAPAPGGSSSTRIPGT
jgi:hypothetical protein